MSGSPRQPPLPLPPPLPPLPMLLLLLPPPLPMLLLLLRLLLLLAAAAAAVGGLAARLPHHLLSFGLDLVAGLARHSTERREQAAG